MHGRAGNHERDWPGTGTRFDFPPARDSGGECGVAYDKRFPMPLQGKDKEWCVPGLAVPILTDLRFSW